MTEDETPASRSQRLVRDGLAALAAVAALAFVGYQELADDGTNYSTEAGTGPGASLERCVDGWVANSTPARQVISLNQSGTVTGTYVAVDSGGTCYAAITLAQLPGTPDVTITYPEKDERDQIGFYGLGDGGRTESLEAFQSGRDWIGVEVDGAGAAL